MPDALDNGNAANGQADSQATQVSPAPVRRPGRVTRADRIENTVRTAFARAGKDPGYFKVFAIGFNKTGTSSIDHIFETLGLIATHGPHWRAHNARTHYPYQAFSDGPPKDFKVLDREYPNTKFILNVRDLGEWLDSRLEHNKIKEGKNLKRLPPELQRYSSASVKTWIQQRNEHHIAVMEYFSARPNDLLIVNFIRDPDPAGKISRFLGFPSLAAEKPYVRSTRVTREAGTLKNWPVIEETLQALGMSKDDLECDLLAASILPEGQAGRFPKDTSEL